MKPSPSILSWTLRAVAVALAFLILAPLWQRRDWPTAEGVVVAQEYPGRRNVRVTIEFVAESGRQTAQTTLSLFEASYARGGGYSPGSAVTVRYNPADPREVEISSLGRWQIPLFAAVLLVIKLFQFICSPARSARIYRRA